MRRASAGSSSSWRMAAAMACGAILHQQAVLAVADDLRQAAHVAGDHRDAGRHGQQRARAQPFAVRDVDEDRGVAQVALQIGRRASARRRPGARLRAPAPRLCADRRDSPAATHAPVRAGADSSSGTPS